MSDAHTLTAARTPTVYFIDDSATMREVIKIAFRKENIHVITCPDAASALAQFNESKPDAVITDVIMPDRDGYEVCEFIRRHEEFAKTPVILMSGVVNRAVAEKAMAVKADELIRKPFQPQDLIIRVKTLLYPNGPPPAAVEESSSPARATSPAPSQSQPHALSGLFSQNGAGAPASRSEFSAAAPPPPRAAAPPAAETQKLRNEIHRLELLVKKLQADLEAQHQYCAALEAHIKTLQEAE